MVSRSADLVRLKAFLFEKLHTLLHGAFAGVHLDADDVARVAQKGVLQLAEPHLRIVREAFVEHHLLAVVRPALGIRTGARAVSARAN